MSILFLLTMSAWIKRESHEEREDDYQLEQLLIVKQILIVGRFGSV